MKIRTKKELQFYMMADMMMSRGKFRPSIKDKLKSFFLRDIVMDYLRAMRRCSYYSTGGGVKKLLFLFH